MYLTGSVQALIVSFISVCVSLIVYDLACALIFRRRSARIRKLTSDTSGMMAALRTPRKLRSEERLLALENCLDDAAVNDPELYQRLRAGAGEAFAKLLRTPERLDEIVLAYILYLAAGFGFFYHTADETVKTQLLFSVTHEKLYLREIVLRCICSIGEEDLLLRALLRLDSAGVSHHFRLLQERLKEFAGVQSVLAAYLAARLSSFSEEMQAVLTEYINAGAEVPLAGGKLPAETEGG